MSSSSQNKEKTSIAIAGLGFGESVHLPALRANNNLFHPLKLWHPRLDRLKEACSTNNLEGLENWKDLLNTSSIDAVIIATPPAPRFLMAKEALMAGKHLLLEKPVTLFTHEIAELQRIAITKQLSVAVDFEYRAVPLFMQAKRLLDQGAIGIPWLVKLDWLMESRSNPSRPWNWYSNSEEGGGVIGALGTHAFDILHWLLGPTTQISGLTSTSIKERIDPKTSKNKNVSSEDVCIAQLTLRTPYGNEAVPGQVCLSSIAQKGRGCWLEIYGSEGTLLLGSHNQKDYVHGFSLRLSRSGSPLEEIQPDSDLIFKTTWSDGRIAPVRRIQKWWSESIQNGTPVIPGLSEAHRSQMVCDSLKESFSSGLALPIDTFA